MCIIVSKEAGQRMPTKATLKTCFENNRDGAGIMYHRNGAVHIDKGHMTFRKFWKVLQGHKFTVDDTVILHFRISTAGKIRPENTHPFPLHRDLNDLCKMQLTCKQAVVHNGMIGEGEGKISDTMVFVRDVLADPIIKNNLRRASVDHLISQSTVGSKLVIMNDKGVLRYYGVGWEKVDGVYFSNTTYKPFKIIPWNDRWKGKGYAVYHGNTKVDKAEDLECRLDNWAVCTACGNDLEELDDYGEYYQCRKCDRIFDENYMMVYEGDDWDRHMADRHEVAPF
jgi:hypothetical protein